MDRAEFIAKLKNGDRVWYQQGVWIQQLVLRSIRVDPDDADTILYSLSKPQSDGFVVTCAQDHNLFPSLDAAIEGMISEKITLSLSGQALVLALQLVTAYGNPEEFRAIAAEICEIGDQFYRSIGGD